MVASLVQSEKVATPMEASTGETRTVAAWRGGGWGGRGDALVVWAEVCGFAGGDLGLGGDGSRRPWQLGLRVACGARRDGAHPSSELQPEKRCSLRAVTPSGSHADSSSSQSWNAAKPIDITVVGTRTNVSACAPRKASSPMKVRPSLSVSATRVSQSRKARAPIDRTAAGSVIAVSATQPLNAS
eukprot:503979-Prymnesium_polylepis.1